jgi:hypothetical protein
MALDIKIDQLSRYILELQDSVIARQEEEISSLKGQMVGLQQQVMVAADRTADFTLKSSGTTPHLYQDCPLRTDGICHTNCSCI